MAHFLNLNEFNHDDNETVYINIAQIEKLVVCKDDPDDIYTITIETPRNRTYTLTSLSLAEVEHLERIIGVKANIESY